MSDMRAGRIGSWVLVACVAAGCARRPPVAAAPRPTRTVPEGTTATDAGARVQTLSRLADEYARQSHDLPGDESNYRTLMAGVFGRLMEILPLLEGRSSTRTFEQQLQIIGNSRAELTNGAPGLSPEPTVNAGLRAAYDALATLARMNYPGQADLALSIDTLSVKINELDQVHGPLSRVTAAEAVEISSEAISQMANVLGQRLAESGTSAGTPAVGESATTEPATEPATTAPAENAR